MAPSRRKDTDDGQNYELRRQKNIQENKAMLKQLLSGLNGIPGLLGMPGIPRHAGSTSPKRSPKTRKSLDCSFIRRRNPSRKARLCSPLLAGTSSVRTRGQKRRADEGEEDEVQVYVDDEELFPVREGEKLVIKFGPTLKKASSSPSDDGSDSDFEVYEDELEELPTPTKRRRIGRPRLAVKSAEEITEEELDMVAECVRDKTYNAEVGTTCHQCRQKTLDMKTICRYDGCTGVRGQFCGPCLRNRYGEDAKTALVNPLWTCPPCRGICNCSFCRKKQGRHATGILIHLARDNGYKSVKEYLDMFARS